MPYEIDKNYNSLDRLDKWDDVTQEVIKKRLEEAKTEPDFFYLAEEPALRRRTVRNTRCSFDNPFHIWI